MCFTACALALGVMAQVPPDASGTDDGGAADAGQAPADATVEAAPAGPTAGMWPNPATSNDGALDDGALPAGFPGGDILAYLGICQSLPAPYSYSAVKAPYTDVAGCKAANPLGHKATHDCACDKCFSLVQQCDGLEGCKEITKCGEDTGCFGNTSLCVLIQAAYPTLACNSAVTCYLAPGSKCAPIIDKWGNGSVSVGLADDLGNCETANKCPTQ
jgi:hypothetical protein